MTNKLLKNTINVVKRSRPNQHRLRNLVINNYPDGCCISGENSLGCDAAHLVPFSDLKFKNTSFEYDPRNAVLMDKTLHSYFDKYLFTFGTNIIEHCNKGFVKLEIILSYAAEKLKQKQSNHRIFNYKYAFLDKDS